MQRSHRTHWWLHAIAKETRAICTYIVFRSGTIPRFADHRRRLGWGASPMNSIVLSFLNIRSYKSLTFAVFGRRNKPYVWLRWFFKIVSQLISSIEFNLNVNCLFYPKVIRTTGNGAPACKICGAAYKTAFRRADGRKANLLEVCAFLVLGCFSCFACSLMQLFPRSWSGLFILFLVYFFVLLLLFALFCSYALDGRLGALYKLSRGDSSRY